MYTTHDRPNNTETYKDNKWGRRKSERTRKRERGIDGERERESPEQKRTPDTLYSHSISTLPNTHSGQSHSIFVVYFHLRSRNLLPKLSTSTVPFTQRAPCASYSPSNFLGCTFPNAVCPFAVIHAIVHVIRAPPRTAGKGARYFRPFYPQTAICFESFV